MSVELYIALKYLKGRTKTLFGLLTTVIAIGGVTLGVTALIITLAVMSGFHNDIKTRLLGLNPHIIVTGEKFTTKELQVIKEIKNVDAVAPFIYAQAVLKSKTHLQGAIIKGIDFNQEKTIVPIEKTLLTSNKQLLTGNDILLGKELAKMLAVSVGDEVIVISPGAMNLLTLPKMYKFIVSGIFSSGMYDYDATLCYVNINQAEKFTHQTTTSLGIKTKKLSRVNQISKDIKKHLPLSQVSTWEELNRSLFAALKLEKIVMFLLLTLIVVVACFNIISNLVLITVEKTKEIGILRALGMKINNIQKIFILEGTIIGVIGTTIGGIGGIIACILLKKYQFIHLPQDVYIIDKLPIKLEFTDIILVLVVSIIISIVSSIYPAYRASKLNPVEILRYE